MVAQASVNNSYCCIYKIGKIEFLKSDEVKKRELYALTKIAKKYNPVIVENQYTT